MLKRPKPGDSEEDILQMQEEYMREKLKNESTGPAAQVVNLRTQNVSHSCEKTEAAPRKISKYAKSRGLKRKEERSGTSNSSDNGDILEKNNCFQQKSQYEDDQIHFPKVIPSVLGDIVEKNVAVSMDLELPMPSAGFPIATKQDLGFVGGSKPITNMFEQSMDVEDTEVEASTSSSSANCFENNKLPHNKQLNLPDQSYILSSKDAGKIHIENVNMLQSMSESDILQEQQKLLDSLDPTLVAFLKDKRKTKPERNTAEKSTKKVKFDDAIDTESVASTPGASELLWDSDILSHPNINTWLNFKSLEKDKLEWIKGIEESKKVQPDEPYEARFDFKGYIMPYTMEYTEKNKTLFHHGEEPHRPGYTLSELFELSRSTVTQQRVVALNTIAGILEYFSTGTYNNIIEIPLSKIFFIVRIAMDENKVILLEPALKAMRNLVFNRIDEACLDALLGFEEGTQQPCLENDLSEIDELESKESELKDFHLAEIDLLTALLRTDILQRIYYILNTVQPSFNCVQYCLQILTRIARNSVESSEKIIEMDHLMKCIITNFVPTTSINFIFDPSMIYKGKPILSALKLVRVLSLQSPEIARGLLDKYDIMRPISDYVSSGVDGTYGLKLQIESFCIVTNLVTYGVGTQQTRSLFPVVVTPLFKHVQGTDIYTHGSVLSATHAAAVLQLINNLLKNIRNDVLTQQAYPLIIEGLRKWMAQLSDSTVYSCAHLRLLSSAIDCCVTLLNRNAKMDFLSNSLKMFAKSNGYSNLTENLIPNSNLLSGIENKHLHHVKNLVTLGASVIDSSQKVLPILNILSPIPFLASLFKLLECLNEPAISELFLIKLENYLKKFAETTPSLSENWFTRMETSFVFSVVNISMKLEMTESNKDLLYAIANKLCYVLRIDKKDELEYLFSNIVFNKDWFTAERLVNLMSVSDSEGFSKALTSIEEIKLCYSKVINLGYISTGPNVVLRNWNEPILPRDWIYLPILSLYSKHQEIEDKQMLTDKEATASKEFIVTCSLEWILFNETCFSDLLTDINVTDRFCRILCVYLCDNSLFLNAHINSLLRRCMRKIFQEEKREPFNFDRQLTGLHNFQDFYTQLLEQFQSVSYGDPVFAAAVLAPVAQPHNAKWRKLLWSEYAGCLRALDCPEDLLCYNLDAYLSPEELDESLIKSYFRALSGTLLRPGTITHRIASHHVSCFKNRSSNKQPEQNSS